MDLKTNIEITEGMSAEEVSAALEDVAQWLNRRVDQIPTLQDYSNRQYKKSMLRSIRAAQKNLSALRKNLITSGF